MPLAFSTLVLILCLSGLTATSVAHATTPARTPPGLRPTPSGSHPNTSVAPASHRATALGGFIKDRTLATVLGETLFRDTVAVMSDSAALSPLEPASAGSADQLRDNSAAGRVARTVLAHRSLDKYLWLIRQAYDDAMWKGGDRTRIEQHFALIWRTSIMLYESTLNANPDRVRVCAPAEDNDGFDCHDETGRARIVPIPAEAPLLVLEHQLNIG